MSPLARYRAHRRWMREHRERITQYRASYPGCAVRHYKQWIQEDEAFTRFADAALDAAAKGAHISELLDSCPDIHGVAMSIYGSAGSTP